MKITVGERIKKRKISRTVVKQYTFTHWWRSYSQKANKLMVTLEMKKKMNKHNYYQQIGAGNI